MTHVYVELVDLVGGGGAAAAGGDHEVVVAQRDDGEAVHVALHLPGPGSGQSVLDDDAAAVPVVVEHPQPVNDNFFV